MTKKILSVAAASALVFAACGGDDDDGGGSVDDAVNALVSAFEADAESDPDLAGVTIDEDCIRGIAEGLPESDLAIITEAFENDGNPEGLSPEGEAAGAELIGCFDFGG